MSNLSDLLLRTVVDPNYATKGATLTFEELDGNLKLLADVIKENITGANPAGIEEYQNNEEYKLGDFVTFQNNLWEYTNINPSTGNAPELTSFYWGIRSSGVLAHAQNTDSYTSKNRFGVGDNSNYGDKEIFARNGSNENLEPRLRFNETTGSWQFSNNGDAFFDFSVGGALSGNATTVVDGKVNLGGTMSDNVLIDGDELNPYTLFMIGAGNYPYAVIFNTRGLTQLNATEQVEATNTGNVFIQPGQINVQTGYIFDPTTSALSQMGFTLDAVSSQSLDILVKEPFVLEESHVTLRSDYVKMYSQNDLSHIISEIDLRPDSLTAIVQTVPAYGPELASISMHSQGIIETVGDGVATIQVSIDLTGWEVTASDGVNPPGILQVFTNYIATDNVPFRFTSKTVASLPSPSTDLSGGVIWVSDASGGSTLAYCDGSQWRRVYDNAIVS